MRSLFGGWPLGCIARASRSLGARANYCEDARDARVVREHETRRLANSTGGDGASQHWRACNRRVDAQVNAANGMQIAVAHLKRAKQSEECEPLDRSFIIGNQRRRRRRLDRCKR